VWDLQGVAKSECTYCLTDPCIVLGYPAQQFQIVVPALSPTAITLTGAHSIYGDYVETFDALHRCNPTCHHLGLHLHRNIARPIQLEVNPRDMSWDEDALDPYDYEYYSPDDFDDFDDRFEDHHDFDDFDDRFEDHHDFDDFDDRFEDHHDFDDFDKRSEDPHDFDELDDRFDFNDFSD